MTKLTVQFEGSPEESENSNDFVLGLEENAIDSLVHAVEHFLADERPTDLKYTVLHVFHATELFLKARLAKTDPELIYEEPRKDGTRNTIGWKELKKRLCKNSGVVWLEEDDNNLKFLQQIRNSIEHHRIVGSRDEIKEYVGRAMYFLDRFLKKELGINLKEQLDTFNNETYQTLAKACVFYVKRMQEHRIPLHPKYKYVDYNFYLCEVCEEETVIFPDPDSDDNTIHCFCCQSRYSVEYCLRCPNVILSLIGPGETIAQDLDEDEEWGFCDRCLEQIADLDE
jgi:hypothetical protein